MLIVHYQRGTSRGNSTYKQLLFVCRTYYMKCVPLIL